MCMENCKEIYDLKRYIDYPEDRDAGQGFEGIKL